MSSANRRSPAPLLMWVKGEQVPIPQGACARCEHFNYLPGEGLLAVVGECRKRPPRYSAKGGFWPRVLSVDGCGGFEKIGLSDRRGSPAKPKVKSRPDHG